MKIFLINRDQSLMRFPAEVATIYNLYFVAEVSMYYTGLFGQIHLWYSRDKMPAILIIELYFGLYRNQITLTKDEAYKLMNDTRRMSNLKNKSKRELELIHRFRSLLETMKKDVIKYLEWFLYNQGVQNWLDLLNTDEAFCFKLDMIAPEKQNEDVIIEILTGILGEGEGFLMFAGNTGDLMKEHALELYTESAATDDACDFYSFPLFNIPYKLPALDEQPLAKETMIQVRKHLQQHIKPISEKMIEFKKEMKAQDFGEATATAALACFSSVQADAAMFQQEVDNDLFLQQMKNATDKWFNVEWRVGVMKIATIPDYYEKALIIQPFVNMALKEKLSLLLDVEKTEVFFYCKLPAAIHEQIEETYRNIKNRVGG